MLGISNLSLVRCTNLQELVYKQGQAGIVKASVTIRFNNSDPKMRPHGYEMEKIDVTREIIVGGKNKSADEVCTAPKLKEEEATNFDRIPLRLNAPPVERGNDAAGTRSTPTWCSRTRSRKSLGS